jgi:hypothetical protein
MVVVPWVLTLVLVVLLVLVLVLVWFAIRWCAIH